MITMNPTKHLCTRVLPVYISSILISCVSLPDAPSLANTQASYDKHTAQFIAENPHTQHSIKRPDGFQIQAREFNVERKGKGPSYVLMHGFPDNQHLYDLLIPSLAKTHHVVSFDFLGWGQSDKPVTHNYKVSSQRVDLDAVVKALELKDLVIVVHDLSGQVGIDWALNNEAKTSELVLLNSYYSPMPTLKAPDAIEFYSRSGVLPDLARWGANKSEARFKDGLANQLYYFMSNPAARQQFIPVFAHSAAAIRPAFFSSVSVLWQELDNRAQEVGRMRMFAKPVRVIFGSDDPFLNEGVARSFSEIFKNNCLQLVPKANHYVQLDNPQAVASAMQSTFKATGQCVQ